MDPEAARILNEAMGRPLSDRSVDSSDYHPPVRRRGETMRRFDRRRLEYDAWYRKRKSVAASARKNGVPPLIPGTPVYPGRGRRAR